MATDVRKVLARTIKSYAVKCMVGVRSTDPEHDPRAVAGLRALAKWIEQLDDDDERLGRIQWIEDGLQGFSLDAVLSRLEFADPPTESTNEDVFGSLVEDLNPETLPRIPKEETFVEALRSVDSPNHDLAVRAHLRAREWLYDYELEKVNKLNVTREGVSQNGVESLELTMQTVRERYEALERDRWQTLQTKLSKN